MASRSGSDPGTKKYAMSFESFVQRIAAVPKDAIEALEAQREKRPPRRRKGKAKKH